MMLSGAVSPPPLTHAVTALPSDTPIRYERIGDAGEPTSISGSQYGLATNRDPALVGARFNSAITLKLQRSTADERLKNSPRINYSAILKQDHLVALLYIVRSDHQ